MPLLVFGLPAQLALGLDAGSMDGAWLRVPSFPGVCKGGCEG